MKIVMTAALLVLSPISSYAAEGAFQTYDNDQNGLVNANEFQARSAPLLEKFDEDDDTKLTVSEMHSLVFHFWDRDDSGGLSKEEFIRPEDWDAGFNALDFTRYDADADDLLDLSEFMAFDASDMYGSWDLNADGLIGNDELSTGVVAVLDVNEEPGLSQEEFSAVPPRL